ncbi:hypothetical protein HHK36_004286 [Tetracentron sinense]|uniref:Uncharacterized protein n=1 Tax=Tetracentron sinense TaxID=13715 RepID=A0A834ZUY7_TETSI|nr:hypothetical protein HHK36_004286 [Tetracentron sinense]
MSPLWKIHIQNRAYFFSKGFPDSLSGQVRWQIVELNPKRGGSKHDFLGCTLYNPACELEKVTVKRPRFMPENFVEECANDLGPEGRGEPSLRGDYSLLKKDLKLDRSKVLHREEEREERLSRAIETGSIMLLKGFPNGPSGDETYNLCKNGLRGRRKNSSKKDLVFFCHAWVSDWEGGDGFVGDMVEEEESSYAIDSGLEEENGKLVRRILLEESDYGYDMGTAGRYLVDYDYQMFLKVLTEKDYVDLVEDDVDPDYKMFLEHSKKTDDVDLVEDDVDPDYKMFLEHLREDGNSYIFEITKADKTSLRIKYEGEGDSSKEVKAEAVRSLRNISSLERMDSVVNKNLKTELLGPVSGGKYGYLSQKPGPTFHPLPDHVHGTESGMVDNVCGIKAEALRSSGNISSRGRWDSDVRKNLKPEPIGHVSCGTYGYLSQKPSPTVFHPPLPARSCGTESAMVDNSYAIFLNCVRTDGKFLILATEDGNWVKYEDDNEIPSDSEILAPFTTSKSFVSSMNEDVCSCIESPNGTPSQFRENLMAILGMPYDQKEFKELLKEATTQKQLERNRYLRGRTVSYATERNSLSYLDYYPADMEHALLPLGPSVTKMKKLVEAMWVKIAAMDECCQ